MSPYGYYSRVQEQMGISYNSLKAYLRDMNYYTSLSRAPYASKLYDKKGQKNMLNAAYLQIPNEHYTRIRPKSLGVKERDGKVQIDKIDYVEIRSLDLNPLDPLGINEKTCEFLHLFLLGCLLKPSPNLNKNQNEILVNKQNLIALSGRANDQILCHKKKLTVTEEALDICAMLEPIAEVLDKSQEISSYSKALIWAKKAAVDSSLTLSGSLVAALERKKNICSFTQTLIKEQKEYFKNKEVPQDLQRKFEQACEQSITDQRKHESKDRALLPGYEDLEQSTQLMIRVAQKRNLEVEVLHRGSNLIKIKDKKKQTIVKQASILELDSYITYELMKDKELTKIFLCRSGIETPTGETVQRVEQGLEAYEKLKDFACVIKPVHTNYGVGVYFIDKQDSKYAKKALEECFKLDTDVIIEKRIWGKEYRFLVIDGKVSGIIYREPANVIGDGVHSIRKLVDLKMQSPIITENLTLLK